MHLSDEEFLSLTPIEFQALMERHQLALERQDFHAGMICATLANIHRDPRKTKAFSPSDFMPTRAKPKHRQTADEMLEVIRTYQAYFEARENGRQ